jgi:hypothetical protein
VELLRCLHQGRPGYRLKWCCLGESYSRRVIIFPSKRSLTRCEYCPVPRSPSNTATFNHTLNDQ